ncbi:hypothetical protein VTN77DRAFT_3367 [Rasamsonia byssochlamydoides]|uniref:uncharacterized protein n=1 Tax=Rasamsonia byssochlamydoides TaxID=89139 RepID=UPI003743E6C2
MQAIASTPSLFRSAARAGSSISSSVGYTARAAYACTRPLSSHQRATVRSSPSVLPGTTASVGSSSNRFSQYLPGKKNSRFRFFSYSTAAAQRYTYRRFEEPLGPGWPGQGRGGGRPPWYVQHRYVLMAIGAVGGFYLYNLETVEMTGRRRFNCISVAQELKLGERNYRDVLQHYHGHILPANHPYTIMVNRVMQRLIPHSQLPGADWKIHVIHDDRMMNAFVLPGGKVFVFTGILPICQDEDGLAAVLGHEIAHVVAHHPAERMSSSFIAMLGVVLISSLFDIGGNLSSMIMNLLYSLPNSRTQEAEADNIGLMMMSKACFNPRAAVNFWGRMQKAEKAAPPQFLSTHPSSYNRMEAIREWLPKAETYYENSGCSFASRYVQGFQDTFHHSPWGW